MTLTRAEFIATIAPMAIEDMKKTNVSAALTIAQAILESADGNSKLATDAFNLFGMKGTGTIGSIVLPTMEYSEKDNQWLSVSALFRRYNNWQESISDHSNLFHIGTNWNSKLYHNVIGKDGRTAAYEVAEAGYATDPDYYTKLLIIMKSNNLFIYDNPELLPEIIGGQQEAVVTAESPDRLTLLEGIVEQLSNRIDRMYNSYMEIDPPEWFVKEFPDALEGLEQKHGTYDFWRSYAAALRYFKNNNS